MGLLQYTTSSNESKNILIDCGKTFFNAALEWFVYYKRRQIDAVLITHGHSDAINGLDDLRQWTYKNIVQSTVDVYCDQTTFSTIQHSFPYLVDSKKATGGGDVVDLKFHVFPDGFHDIVLFDELIVNAFPVHHGFANGSVFYSLGFRFNEFAYISDLNLLPKESREILRGIKVLVIDSLSDNAHTSHMTIEQAIQEILLLEPERAFLTGFSHSIDHDELTERLKKDERLNNIRVRAAFDGLKLEF